ncbi:MAG TPA: hypothetical protein VFY73_20535 [Ideonella sp.]|uniref:hypothetical protein n=1 Tax=Ideonella sp. TaxID=1929293 RepID=UPI002E3291B8|nr:hypothetical protein [Ideonella sp.]HEX5686423.1 hypothetical protein [Ideonella sp.]
MIKHSPPQPASAWLALLACLLAVVPLAGCDPRPKDVPRPSDPDRNLPKPITMPDTKAPDGVPASAARP